MAPKIKNPLLNKQALPGSYADYLTADRNNYAAAQQFDQIIANNEKIQNSPTPILTETITNAPTPTAVQRTYAAPVKMPAADTVVSGDQTPAASPNLIPIKSYTEWLEAGGMTGMAQKQYDAAVRAAETDYAKSKALYGQNAETLGRAGLTGSGYGDYLTGAGFAAMQGAKVAAADTRALTEAQQRSDYANYLMTVDAQNREAQAVADAQNRQTYAEYLTREGGAKQAIEDMMLSGNDDAAIRAYIQQHYGNEFDAQLDSWITGARAYTDPILAKQQEEQAKIDADKAAAETDAAEAEALARAQAAAKDLATLVSNGLVAEAAKVQMRSLGYTEDEINSAFATQQNAQSEQMNLGLDLKGVAINEFYTSDDIDNLVATEQITKEQGEQYKQDARTKRATLLKDEFDSFQDMDEDAAAQALANWKATIDSLSANDLTDADRAELYGMLADGYISDAVESREPVTSMLKEISMLDKNKIGDAAYNGFVDQVAQTIDNISYRYVGQGLNNSYVRLTIKFGKKENGQAASETVKLGIVDLPKIAEGTPVDSGVNEKLGQGSDGEIKVYNGTLYIHRTALTLKGKKDYWSPLGVNEMDVGGKENAKILNDILVDYYS